MKIIDVFVKPGSKKPGITREDGRVVLRVRERAIDGAANAACLLALAKEYGVPLSRVELVAGSRSRQKRFAIDSE